MEGQNNTSRSIYAACGHIYGLALNEESVQYLVILDEDTEVHYSLSYRNSDVPSVWTEVLNGRVGTSRNLNRRSHSDVYTLACLYTLWIFNMLHINATYK